MKRLLLGAALAAATLFPAAANAQTSKLEWADGSQSFDLCFTDGCVTQIQLNNNINQVLVSVATGIFDPVLNPGAATLVNPLPSLSLRYDAGTGKFVSTADLQTLFDGIPTDGVASAVTNFFASSTFTGVDGGALNDNLVWDFDPAKLGVGISGVDLSTEELFTASLTLNSTPGAGTYSATIQTRTISKVPAPLGVAGVVGMFGWARRLRRRIDAAA